MTIEITCITMHNLKAINETVYEKSPVGSGNGSSPLNPNVQQHSACLSQCGVQSHGTYCKAQYAGDNIIIIPELVS